MPSERQHDSRRVEPDERAAAPAVPLSPAAGNAAIARALAAGAPAGDGRVPADVAAGVDAARGQGSVLPAPVRGEMESTFGTDFSGVRLHRGPSADGLNESVGAVAFTSGTDIFWPSGLDPGAGQGREVLAHELTHVVQNVSGGSGPAGTVSRPNDPAEVEASRVAAAVASGAAPNHAVLRMLRSGGAPSAAPRTGPPTVRRWASDEHLRLGDTTGMTIDIGDGVELTFGQVVALAGDEIGDLDQLTEMTRTPDGRAMIRAHLERAGLPPAQGTGKLPQPKDAAERDAQMSRANTEYVTLAMENTTHFSAGGTAVQTWAANHARAVDHALQAGFLNDPTLLNQARLAEAFGAHFLTDAFSAGHVRVPREQILNYYLNTVAPSVYDHLVEFLRRHLVDELYDQIEPQTSIDDIARGVAGPWYGGGWARGQISGRINDAVVARLNQAVAQAGGRDQVIRYLGLGLAGLVCGALHDADNRDGLMVISAAHPDPWQAFGDGLLDRNALHRERAEEALAVSVQDLTLAYDIGAAERMAVDNPVDLSMLPSVVYFAFGRADASPETVAAVDLLSQYLRYTPSTVVTLTGHTDPIGTEGANEGLGLARAQTVESLLTADGIDPSRLSTVTMGERSPVTANAKQYARNRRVEFGYATDAALAATQEPAEDIALRHMALVATNRVGPPYAAQRHIPQESPGVYADLPDWEWQSISGNLEAEMNKWVVGYLHEYRDKVLASSALDDQEVSGYTIRPRPIVQGLLFRIEHDPVGFLREALGN